MCPMCENSPVSCRVICRSFRFTVLVLEPMIEDGSYHITSAWLTHHVKTHRKLLDMQFFQNAFSAVLRSQRQLLWVLLRHLYRYVCMAWKFKNLFHEMNNRSKLTSDILPVIDCYSQSLREYLFDLLGRID